jgi:hypothetical protein
MRRVLLAAGLCVALMPARVAAQTNDDDPFADRWLRTNSARLEALDKVTGRTTQIETRIEAPIRFGTLDIVVRSCHARPPELPPDSAGYLEVSEQRAAEDEPRVLFTGWMFAATPGLSTLEHPVYDVIVLECYSASVVEEEVADEAIGNEASDKQSSGEDSAASE